MINEYEAANLEINKNKWILKSNNYRTPPKFRKKYLSFCACDKNKKYKCNEDLIYKCLMPGWLSWLERTAHRVIKQCSG